MKGTTYTGFLKTDLQVIVTNIQTLDKLLNKFQNDNLIKIEKKK